MIAVVTELLPGLEQWLLPDDAVTLDNHRFPAGFADNPFPRQDLHRLR